MNKPMDIIILAGQSNAVGYGCGEADYQLKHLDKMFLMYDDQAEDYSVDENGNEYMAIYEPWKIKLIEAVNGYTGSLALRFADAYIENGYLAQDRKLLIVRCAVGGTGFSKKLWGVGQLLYRRMLDLTSYALSLNPENRVVAFLWHQGECDAFENADWTPEKRKESYYRDLRAVVEGVRNHCRTPNLPFLCGGFTDEWSKDYREACDAVVAAQKQICVDLGWAAFTDTTGLLSNNQKVGNGDTIHFCKDAVYTIGQRYFDKYRSIILSQANLEN